MEYFFRGMEDWMSQSLGRAKPNEVKPVLENRTKGKRDINTWWWWPTQPTNQHAQLNGHTCFAIGVWFLVWKNPILCIFWSNLPMCTICGTIQILSDTFQGLSHQLKGRRCYHTSKSQEEDEKPTTQELSFCSPKTQEEDEKSSRPDRYWLQGWQKNWQPRDKQVKTYQIKAMWSISFTSRGSTGLRLSEFAQISEFFQF